MPKKKIHPKYDAVRVMCACGNNFETRSTHKGDIHVEICSNCHPFFTGKQRLVDTAGSVERSRRKCARADSQTATATATKYPEPMQSDSTKRPPLRRRPFRFVR